MLPASLEFYGALKQGRWFYLCELWARSLETVRRLFGQDKVLSRLRRLSVDRPMHIATFKLRSERHL